MYPQSMFWAKIRKISKISSENEHFYSREILLYIAAWACLRNVTMVAISFNGWLNDRKKW